MFVLLICLVVVVCAHPHHTGCTFQHNRLATAGRRSFPVAASILWNSLPPDIQSSTSFTDFWLNCSTNHFQTSCLNRSHIDFASVDFVMSPAYYNLATLTIPIDLMMGV